MTPTKSVLFPEIGDFLKSLRPESIPTDRREILNALAAYIQSKVTARQAIRLNFICTHNSRRSHLSQVWAQTLAQYFGLAKVISYSGGTEETALFPKVADTLHSQGFNVLKLSEGANPVYAIKYAENEPPIIGFSKKMDHPFNPASEFAAIMTCDSANEACPFVPGAEKRFPITFEDPKTFDHTPEQSRKYLERSIQIATELWYVFSQINP
ncbi:arsenate-mycothiol transferase ArsC [Robiginitalea sediminis]|uniref:arsenate-mycothiol transferase ArsC n=1 Tax=Robiginitalea sediminis TaxID=1982593 RepID=UPI000B4AA394|nr:protein-tyrosine-phosphatase [Robiginitalea sediminis]